jgi:hypothetical protein
MNVPERYVPETLKRADKKKQGAMIIKSRTLYKKHKYFTRPKISSFKSKESKHVAHAKRLYGVATVAPSEELARKTGCKVAALEEIVRKGEGAYFSSGSRPNQTAHSWAFARLASSVTGGKASVVDFSILEKGCNKRGTAYRLAKKMVDQNKNGLRRTRKVKI